VGQIKLPKWAEKTCQTHPIAKAGSGDVDQLAGFTLTRGKLLHEERRIRASVYELSPFLLEGFQHLTV
jgi:hypothetical protein